MPNEILEIIVFQFFVSIVISFLCKVLVLRSVKRGGWVVVRKIEYIVERGMGWGNGNLSI